MDKELDKPDHPANGGHFMVAVTGSGNSEYLIRWTDTAARRLNATWSALHVRDASQADGADQAADAASLASNLELARDLGAEVIAAVDSDVAACIVRYARIKKAGTLVIGKASHDDLSFLGGRSLMDDILRQSGDLDVIILRGKAPVPLRRPRPRPADSLRQWRGWSYAALSLLAITALGVLAQPALGYRSVSILYLVAIISLPFVCSRTVVFSSAALSALLWNFLFIPPRLTFTIGSLEDILMFLAFFLAAFVGGFLTTRLKAQESALRLRERRMAFLYGFTRSVARIRGVEAIVAFARDFLMEHLGLEAAVRLKSDPVWQPVNPASPDNPASPNDRLAARCLEANDGLADGDDRFYLPLGSPDSVFGVLYVASGDQQAIRGESRELLAALAGNMALAIERELLAAENERNKMAGETARLSRILLNHVSHELRTPLTTIKGSVSGLLEGPAADDPALRETLLAETIIAADRLNALVEDLLAMSRLEAGHLRPHPEFIYISELAGAAQLALGLDLGGRAIIIDEASKDAEILVDPGLMTQVFRNIVRNFVAYTPPGAQLRIKAAISADQSLINFADDGPGVPDRERPLLFDTFYRGSAGAARQGCGLGLSICKGIAESHGGSIAAGPSPSGGLQLTLTLPKEPTP
ncbi:MAG: hypothetical protein A2087_12770 [Spirochaetes bacterium GWD1_61_31]|nr:MAG: hypothetical protein A2Y37_05810 [Spirochaetes bacterium GWB1_60_80]OHD34532.1 MAG: hypothetical protein A2004_08930 [Spirochaetes bacterium GWC1_61_12]OHD38136.1 MAG: hypothetical protein A2087_12770 [Spirochaetes bacterium GWD1_61_31]OHD42978.1 MAG: hypothetical protein A2Y35_14230 [Spirochaetes bacterium GWE1_60_18]OHD58703.1 MAG: hypothetical protein A2Y32_02135 [Spirochaetes bacterium GWF1_60_12]